MALHDNLVVRSLSKLQSRFAAFGSFVRRLGTSLIWQGIFRAAPLAIAVKNFADFDDQMRLAGAVAGATTDELARMTEQAKLLGRTTSFTAAQVAAMMVELGRAGFKPDEINAMTAAVLGLSRATGTDAALSAEIMSSTIRQFGLNAEDATRVADALAAAANKSNASVDGLGESLKYAGPVAADLNLSIEETLALLSALANVGIKGSEAGTGLRRLAVIAAANGEAFEKFGVATKDAQGNLLPLVAILDDFFRATQQMGNAQRTEAFESIFGLLGITSASALSKNAASVRELFDAIKSASGEAGRTAKEMDAGIGGALRRLRSAIEGVVLSFGDAAAPMLTQMAERLTFVGGAIAKFLSENRAVASAMIGSALGFLAAGTALITLGIAAGSLGSILGLALTVLSLTKVALLALLTPAGLITAAIVGIGIVWAAMTEDGMAFTASLGSAFQSMGVMFQDAWQGINDAIASGNVKLAMDIAVAGMEAAWARGMRVLTEIWLKFRNTVIAGWVAVRQTLEEAIGGWVAMWLHITEGKQAAQDFVKQMAEMQKQEVKDFTGEGNRQRQEAIERERDALDRLHGLIVEANERRLERQQADEEKKRKEGMGGVPPPGSGNAPFRVSDVAGGLAAPGLRERFGIRPGQFEKESLVAQKQIALNTGQLNKRLGDVAKSLRFH